MNTPITTVAVAIDGDNTQLKYTKQIIQFCETYGVLSIKNAYGDWKKLPLSSHCQTMLDVGVNPIQQNRVGKNATDFRLAMDVALMLDKGEANIYFIVSSDGDFTTVCERIRQKGAKVIGIGNKSLASKKLRNACHAFFDVEEIVKPTTTLEILIQAYQRTPQKHGWVHLAQLGKELRQIDQQFDERFTSRKLSDWFRDFPYKFEVANDRVRIR